MMLGSPRPFIRNLGRSPGYGLRGQRGSYGPSDTRPVGPALVKGRGLSRRREPSYAPSLIALALALLAGLALVAVLFWGVV